MVEHASVLVFGGTGRQGGAAARHLLAGGWHVRALVRDTTAAPAVALQQAGAVVVRGDFDDEASMRRAMAGVHGVFSVQTFIGPGGIAAEVRRGRTVAEIAAEVGVAHLVYSSVGGAERGSRVPHFESKLEIEEHIRSLGLRHTILRTVFFMENLAGFGGPVLVDDTVVVRQALHPETRLQMVAVDDIGAFVALAFDHPDDFQGAQLELAGDELTGPQIASLFGALAGRRSRFEEQPLTEIVPSATTWPPCTSSSTTAGTRRTSRSCERGIPGCSPCVPGQPRGVGRCPDRNRGRYSVNTTARRGN